MDGLFLDFCRVAQSVGEVASRLEKARILGEYFSTLGDENLRRAALYLGGALFPLREGRVVAVGGAQIRSAILGVTGVDENWLAARLVAHGDWGDVALEAFEQNGAAPQSTLSLEHIETRLALLAATSGSKKKLELVSQTLRLCTPLEAKFWCKMLGGDLRIGLKEGQVEDALARMASVSVGEIQRANMLTGDLGEVAVFARHGRLSETKFQLFHPLKFMLASPTETASDVARQMPPAFVIEDKFDGIRAQVHLAPHFLDATDALLHGEAVSLPDGRAIRAAFFSRTLDEITRSFPDLKSALAALLPLDCAGLVLDGEIVPVAGETILPFQILQQRLGRKTVSEETLAKIPVAFVAYDLLFDGENRLESPLSERRTALEKLDFNGQNARLCASQTVPNDDGLEARLDAEFGAARARGNEGLMVKDPRAPYKPGRRGREWLKVKRALATLDVVVTSVEKGSGKRARFYSDFTFAVRASEDDPTLLNVGKAYSGLTDAEIQSLSDWFVQNTIQEFAHGRVRVVKPEIVLEVAFDNVQVSARHKSGFALRFPRILRIRDDKPASEIDTVASVAKLANSAEQSAT